MTRKQLKPRNLTAWITRETLGEEYTTPGGRKLRRRIRRAIDPNITKKDFERDIKVGAIGRDDSFIVEWQCRIDGETKRFSQRASASGWEGFLEARAFRNEVQGKLETGELEQELSAVPVVNLTLAQAIEAYERDRPKVETKKTEDDVTRVLKRFREVVGDNVLLKNITSQNIDIFVNALKDRFSLGIVTVNKELRYLEAFFNTMVKWRKLTAAVDIPQFTEPTP